MTCNTSTFSGTATDATWGAGFDSDWSCPVPGSHVTGQSYLWSGWVYDGGQWNWPQTDPTRCSFTY